MIKEMNKEIIEREQHNQKRIMELNKEIKRLKEEYIILQNASDEVEIIEDKKIEKLQEEYYHNEPAVIDDMVHKINEIINYINKVIK